MPDQSRKWGIPFYTIAGVATAEKTVLDKPNCQNIIFRSARLADYVACPADVEFQDQGWLISEIDNNITGKNAKKQATANLL